MILSVMVLTTLAGQALADDQEDRVHPLWKLENVYPLQDVGLKISAMAFEGEDLYVTVFTPDRTDKAPFKEGEVFRVTGLIDNSDRSKIQAERLMGGLYEPTAIAVHAGKIYIGEKDKISRLEDRNGDGKFTQDEQVVLIDGLSAPNFHTYTVGFGVVEREGKSYLAGNLTTSILLGGARAVNLAENPKTRRGSTFLVGPVTGEEQPAEVDISYVAGGYRTPNGFGVGPDGEMIVTDNQGVFNPSNEFIRVTPGAFYGHFLLDKKDAKLAAFQPAEADSEIGGSRFQTPPTVHLPQGNLDRSPSQPIYIKDLEGSMAVYNGQWLVGDLTMGRINRVFLEQVGGIWQGAAFRHSGGHDPKGEIGFTAGPNRLVRGPDGHIYIGHIGDGGLWRFQPKAGEEPKPLWGLQRLSSISRTEVPNDFNEMVAVRDIPGGLEVEFFRPVGKEQLDALNLAIRQWTYVPTNGYGGRDFGTEDLTATSRQLSLDGRRLRIAIPGIRDNSPPFVTHGNYSNENVGWVVELTLGGMALYQDQAWYSMIHHQGGGVATAFAKDQNALESDPAKYAESQYRAVCAACHSLDGTRITGPSFKGLAGLKQQVIRDGKTIEVVVDREYLLRAIREPLYEAPVGYPPAMPNLGLSAAEEKAMVDWIMSPAVAGANDEARVEPITPDRVIDLFNGTDLSNWIYDIFDDEIKPADIYKVEDRVIKNAGKPLAVMRTKQAYQDYELEVQWRWPGNGGNSGVLLHCSTPRNRKVWPQSIEAQLASKDAGDFWVIGEKIRVKDTEKRTKDRRTINYTDDSEKEIGEWNTMIVQARGDTLKVFINGTLVNEAWDCSARSGAICLQAEGTPIEYRKVQLRPLPES